MDILERLRNAVATHRWDMSDEDVCDLFRDAGMEITRLRNATGETIVAQPLAASIEPPTLAAHGTDASKPEELKP